MITAAQLCAAMSLAGINRRNLAKAPRLSLPAVQWMEANDVMNELAPLTPALSPWERESGRSR